MTDFVAYRDKLEASQSRSQQFMRTIRNRARGSKKRIIFADGQHETIIRASRIIREEELAIPVLVGREELIQRRARENGVDLDGVEIVDPYMYPERRALSQHFYEKRQRKGINWLDARFHTRRPDWFATLMLDTGQVDGMVCGIGRSHPLVMQAVLQIISLQEGVRRVSGMYVVLTRNDIYFLADCTAKADPTAEELAETALLTARVARKFFVTPKIAMLSYSNFGTGDRPEVKKVREAVKLVRAKDPSLVIDGEMQADVALSAQHQKDQYPFCELNGPANVLIFPNLSASLLAAKMIKQLGNAELIGPLTLGFAKPLNVLQLSCDVDDVVNATAITVIACLDGVL
jgi:malate dehydrogenase (oxaloacetate-decarboxylating)(NADP+)